MAAIIREMEVGWMGFPSLPGRSAVPIDDEGFRAPLTCFFLLQAAVCSRHWKITARCSAPRADGASCWLDKHTWRPKKPCRLGIHPARARSAEQQPLELDKPGIHVAEYLITCRVRCGERSVGRPAGRTGDRNSYLVTRVGQAAFQCPVALLGLRAAPRVSPTLILFGHPHA